MNPSTGYITVVEKDRNVCLFINSIAHLLWFGDRLEQDRRAAAKCGAGFRIQLGHPNCSSRRASVRLHTIIPGLATKNGRAVMPFGVMGGQYQSGRAVSHTDQHARLRLGRAGGDDMPRGCIMKMSISLKMACRRYC